MSSSCEANEKAVQNLSESGHLPSSRHVDLEAEEGTGSGAAGVEQGALPPVPHSTVASAGTGNDSTPEPTKVTADPRVVAGDVSSPEQHLNSEEHPPESLCSENVRKPSPSDSCTVSLADSTVSSLATPQSIGEIKKREDMPSSSVSTDNNLSPDICSEVMNKSSQGADIADASALTLTSQSSSTSQSIECGSTKAESSQSLSQETWHGKSSLDESDVTDKSSRDDKQSEKESPSCEGTATAGEAGDGRARPEIMPASSTDSDDEKQSIYHVKWIKHKGTPKPIITQNENGPCPLLAIMNLLLLQSKIKLASGAEVVTSNELMAHLADWIFENVPKNISEGTRLNYEQNMHDAIAVFPRLQTGLDVNVRFTGVSQFEYTPECIVFDLLGIPFYHGWLVDPQMPDLVSAIGNRTYNQLVEKIIVQKNSNKEELVAEALLAEEFLNVTASQLTYYGLSELSATTKEDEMCVLFRNNHFSTLYKHKNELFVLVTDQGFLRESNVVWETLSNIEGDGHFVDSEFRTYCLSEAATTPMPTSSFPINSKEQIDHDYLVALSLEQEQSEMQPGASWSGSAALSDHELALRLQEEENMSAKGASGQPTAPKPDAPVTAGSNLSATGSGSSVPGKEKKDGGCLLM